MAKDKKVEQITDMEVDFAQWFTDVCTKAELVDYSGVKGLFVLRPYGYAIWENIQAALDAKFKATGHTNVSMPMLIPESLLQKEKDHVEGFAPECAWVTIGGIRTNDRLQAIDGEGVAIPGLYVAGADNGTLMSAPYCDYEGYSLMCAYCGGRLAGQYAVETIDA